MALCLWQGWHHGAELLVSWRPGNNERESQDPSVFFKDTLHPPVRDSASQRHVSWLQSLLLSPREYSDPNSNIPPSSVPISLCLFVFLWLLTQGSICTCYAWMHAVPYGCSHPFLLFHPITGGFWPGDSGFSLGFTYWFCAKLYFGLLASTWFSMRINIPGLVCFLI